MRSRFTKHRARENVRSGYRNDEFDTSRTGAKYGKYHRTRMVRIARQWPSGSCILVRGVIPLGRYRILPIVVLALCLSSGGSAEELLVVPGITGHSGGRVVYGERAEAKSLNPIFAVDAPTRDVVGLLMADLVHINRATLKTEPALAKSYRISADGLRYVVELRQGLKFSDGHPFDADDVVFTFQVYLDEKVNAPQRSMWILDGKPVVVRKLDRDRVQFELPRVNAVGERIFDSIPMLPRHLLESAYRQGKLAEAWGLRTPAMGIAGLGPFRLKEYVLGARVVLERNPYYWKSDATGTRLPYLDELAFTFAATEALQVMRFQSGESDLINRIAAKDYAILQRESATRGHRLEDAGAGFEQSFLFFNLNDSVDAQASWRRPGFRKAVSAAVDRDAIVRLVYQGYATPLSSPVAAGNKLWIHGKLPPPVRSLERARAFLAADGFTWSREGALLDAAGRKVAFTIAASTSNAERLQTATLIQADLQPLGIQVNVVSLEFRSLVDRVLRTHEYDACIFALSETDADPNVDLQVWLSSGSLHLWKPDQKQPATAWEAEIDGLMGKQLMATRYEDRKRLFDRVQELAMENLPLIPLVSPHVLVGARKLLGNFRPGLLEPYTLSNAEELYWLGNALPPRR